MDKNMKCKCGNKIKKYRIIGALLSFDDLDGYDSQLLGLRIGSVFRAMAVVECEECGRINFYKRDAKILNNMVRIKNNSLIKSYKEPDGCKADMPDCVELPIKLLSQAVKRLSMPVKKIRGEGFGELMTELRGYLEND